MDHSKVNQATRRKMKQAKENWISDRCQEIDCGIRTGNSKTAFNAMKFRTERQQTKTNLIENANTGNVLEQSDVAFRTAPPYGRSLFSLPMFYIPVHSYIHIRHA